MLSQVSNLIGNMNAHSIPSLSDCPRVTRQNMTQTTSYVWIRWWIHCRNPVYYPYGCMYMRMCIYIYIYIYTHTYIYIYTSLSLSLVYLFSIHLFMYLLILFIYLLFIYLLFIYLSCTFIYIYIISFTRIFLGFCVSIFLKVISDNKWYLWNVVKWVRHELKCWYVVVQLLVTPLWTFDVLTLDQARGIAPLVLWFLLVSHDEPVTGRNGGLE